MFQMTQWTKPGEGTEFLSYMIKAKLSVPCGRPVICSGGDSLGYVRWPSDFSGPAAYLSGICCSFGKAEVRLIAGRVLSSSASTVGRKRAGRDGFPFGRLPREE